MSYNFEAEVKRHQEKEVQSFLSEQSIKEEEYTQQVIDEGYDNTHDYESNIFAGLIKRILIFISIIILTLLYIWL